MPQFFQGTMGHLLRPGEKGPGLNVGEPESGASDLADIEARLEALAKEQRDEETGYEEEHLTDTAAGE